jgi:hypothetical protein
MLFKEIITFYSENHTKPVDTTSGQDAEVLHVKTVDTHSYYWFLKG